jgi:hypothetical protein
MLRRTLAARSSWYERASTVPSADFSSRSPLTVVSQAIGGASNALTLRAKRPYYKRKRVAPPPNPRDPEPPRVVYRRVERHAVAAALSQLAPVTTAKQK